jgi:hypothetical protein
MTDAWAATARFTAVAPGGERNPLTIRLGIPQPVGPNEWSCVLALDGLMSNTPIHGEDSLQSLGLAWRYAATMLYDFESQGGHFEFDTGDRVPLDAYFGKPRTSAG